MIRRNLNPLTFLVAANAVSLTGNVIATVAVPWLVLTTTCMAPYDSVPLGALVKSASNRLAVELYLYTPDRTAVTWAAVIWVPRM